MARFTTSWVGTAQAHPVPAFPPWSLWETENCLRRHFDFPDAGTYHQRIETGFFFKRTRSVRSLNTQSGTGNFLRAIVR